MMRSAKSHVVAFACLAIAGVCHALTPEPRIPLWPEGKTPDFRAPQTSPYIEWLPSPCQTSDVCVILISGGSYTCCCDGKWIDLTAEAFNARGVSCVRLIYRTPRPAGLPIWKTAWEDGQRAVRLVRRAAAARGIDPEKIGVFGYSAGAHLTALLATSSQTPAYDPVDEVDSTPCHVAWAVPVYPAYLLDDGPTGPNARMGLFANLAPELKFDAKTPPMCFFHGGADPYSPLGSTAMCHKLRTMGIPAEMHLYAKGPHGFFTAKNGGRAEYQDRMFEWLLQIGALGKPGAEVAFDARNADESVTASREKFDLWPAGKMPSVQTNQTVTPYLEWFFPKDLRTRAIQMVFPGGGYIHLSTLKEGEAIARAFNSRGMTCVVVGYRVPRPVAMPKHQTAFEDAQRAIRMVRMEAARRGLDPELIGGMGFSAGGHLTLMCATSSMLPAYRAVDDVDKEPCHLNWAVPVYPAYVLTDGSNGANAAKGNGLDAMIVEDFAFDPKTPPMCLLHGDADVYSAMGSVKTWQKLRRMGLQSDLHVFATRGHCFYFKAAPGTGSYNWIGRIFDFFEAYGFNAPLKQ